MIRFIHSSDLHLGKRFGNFAGDLPGRLREARHAVIRRLAEHARTHGVDTILLAGDTFDTETPAAEVRRQALTEMAHHDAIRWILLPGNHDSLQATELWTLLAREAPDNVVLAMTAEPVELASGAILLPAPCTTQRPGRDLSAWMDGAATPNGAIHIGLATARSRAFPKIPGRPRSSHPTGRAAPASIISRLAIGTVRSRPIHARATAVRPSRIASNTTARTTLF